MNTKIKLLLFIFCVFFSSSCAFRNAATAITGDILTRGMIDMETEEDIFVAKEASLPLLKIAEVLHNGDTSNKQFLALLSKSYGNYAFGIAEPEALAAGTAAKKEEWTVRAGHFYKKGMSYGIGAISDGKTKINDLTLTKFRREINRFGPGDSERLFWTAFDWGQYINMNKDDIGSVAELPMVDIIVDRVIETNPDFQCGISFAFKAAMIVGNPLNGPARFDTARPLFEKAMSYCDGNFLMTKVMFAEWFAAPSGDKKLFDNTLNGVIEADASKLPRYRLANELAKERARLLKK